MKSGFILLVTILSISAKAQTIINIDSSGINYMYKNGSLFISKDSVITVGQKLIVGKGSDKNGWYKSIGFKSAFAWPIWLFMDSELDNEDDPDESYRRKRDKVRDYVSLNETLQVTKIKKKGNKRRGYTFIVYLSDKSFPGLNYYCNIKLALETKEILMP